MEYEYFKPHSVLFFIKLTQNFGNLSLLYFCKKTDVITGKCKLQQNSFKRNLICNINCMACKTPKVFPYVNNEHFIYILETGNSTDGQLHGY